MYRAAALALVLIACSTSVADPEKAPPSSPDPAPYAAVVETGSGDHGKDVYVPWVPQRASCERCFADCTSACHDQGGYVESAGTDLYCCSR